MLGHTNVYLLTNTLLILIFRTQYVHNTLDGYTSEGINLASAHGISNHFEDAVGVYIQKSVALIKSYKLAANLILDWQISTYVKKIIFNLPATDTSIIKMVPKVSVM